MKMWKQLKKETISGYTYATNVLAYMKGIYVTPVKGKFASCRV